jgi:hypothetical protein
MPRLREHRAWVIILAVLAGSFVVHMGGILTVDRWVWTVGLLQPDEVPPPAEEVEVKWVVLEEKPTPELTLPPTELVDKKPDPEDEEEKEEKEKEKKKPPKLAQLEPPKPEPPKAKPPKPPPPPPPAPKKVQPPPPPPVAKVEPPKPKPKEPEVELVKVKPQPKKPPPKLDRKKMVEIQDDKNVSKKPNLDAKYYSDKDRVVSEETYAKDRNLEKTSKGKQQAAAPDSKITEAEDLGGDEEKKGQAEETKATKLDAKRVASVHNGTKHKSEGLKTGKDGQNGQKGGGGDGGAGGTGGDGGQDGQPGALSMRNVEGRGAPGKNPMKVAPGAKDDSPEVAMSTEPKGKAGAPGKEGAPGKPGKAGKKGPKLTLDQDKYERIVGEDKADREVELAQKRMAHKKGKRWKKFAKMQSTLETFTGEVKPGNQTALGTRAHPFAVYIARMHNRIHEVWGYGFIEDLNNKSYGNAMNDRSLAVTMEIVVAPDGEIEKVTIVKTSGLSTFDIAAADTVYSAGPYEETPEDIRSANGYVYLHWTFHRDDRLCSPYFADPFILDNPKAGHDHAKHDGKEPREPERLRRNDGEGGAVEVPRVSREQVSEGKEAPTARTDDPKAEEVSLAWANAFEKDDIAALVGMSELPFRSRDKVVAEDAAGVAHVWRIILNETDKREVSEWKLLSAAGYRALFGSTPPGGGDGTSMLFLVAKVDGQYVTMSVVLKDDGSYKIVGF